MSKSNCFNEATSSTIPHPDKERTIYLLNDELIFPHPQEADSQGLLAVGGDLRPERLLLAYRHGIFPWYDESLPILWYSPNPRMVLLPHELRINRSLRKSLRKRPYEIRLDTAFARVIEECSRIPRPGQQASTWITEDMKHAYNHLHRLGFAHSAEAWHDGELVGGLYGVSLGRGFFGESMFAKADDASKIALVTLVRQLQRWDFTLIDCQVHTPHLAGLGGKEWPRQRFLDALEQSVKPPTLQGSWSIDPDLARAPYDAPPTSSSDH